jgi:UPF0716 family protein affecting phage T7 exclusion
MNIPPRNMSTITCPIFITGMGMRNDKGLKMLLEIATSPTHGKSPHRKMLKCRKM